jgi:dTDP-4-amino-4,6-dideoxygalactose transaminase
MITTNNDEWAEWMTSYKHFGMDMSGGSREGIQFDIIGTNYKLSNILSAIGLGQMRHIDSLLEKRQMLAQYYIEILQNTKGVTLPRTTDGGMHSYQSICIYVDNRDMIMTKMREKGIEVQIGTYSLHMHNAFNNHPLVRVQGDMKNSRWCYEHTLTIPLFDELTEVQQNYIIHELSSVI